MPKRKKPPVRPEQRRQWLQRFEEKGESPPQIAKTDSYDVRTVRKQLDMARQEREMREARTMVLRQALEKHYAGLCDFAQKLESNLSWPPNRFSALLQVDPLWQALKEHLPRSPIWKATERWEHLVGQFELCTEQVEQRARADVQARGWKFAQAPGGEGLDDGFGNAVVLHVVSLAKGRGGLKDVLTFSHKEATDTGLHETRMGAYLLGIIHPDDITSLKTIYLELLDEAIEWEEGSRLEHVVLELQSQMAILRDELTTIRLKGVVPGRCKYCPL